MSRNKWIGSLYHRLLSFLDIDVKNERTHATDNTGFVNIEDISGFSIDTHLSDGSRLTMEGKPSKRAGLEIIAALYSDDLEIDRVTLEYDGSNHTIKEHTLTDMHVANRLQVCGEDALEFYAKSACFIKKGTLADDIISTGMMESSDRPEVDASLTRDLTVAAVTRSACLLASKYRDEFSAILATETATYLNKNGVKKEISSLVVAGNLREAAERQLKAGVKNTLGLRIGYDD